jgi:hypothetical protein
VGQIFREGGEVITQESFRNYKADMMVTECQPGVVCVVYGDYGEFNKWDISYDPGLFIDTGSKDELKIIDGNGEQVTSLDP